MQIREFLLTCITLVVMVHRIIPHSDSGTVQAIIIRSLDMVQCEPDLPVNPPALPVIWNKRQKVPGRELIVRQSESFVTELVLNEIDEAHREGLGLLQSLPPLFRRHLYNIDIEVIPLNRPVNHILSTRQPAVAQHHIRRPDTVRFLGIYAKRVRTATGIESGVIIHWPVHTYVPSIIFQNSYASKVLNNPVSLSRSDSLPCHFPALHPDIVRHTAACRNVAKLRSINENPRPDPKSPAIPGNAKSPASILKMPDSGHAAFLPDREHFLLRAHCIEDFIADGRLELDIAHPAGTHGIHTSVMSGEPSLELPPEARRQIVAAVSGTHSGTCQHTAEPGQLLYNQCPASHPRSLDSGSASAGPSAYDDNIIFL